MNNYTYTITETDNKGTVTFTGNRAHTIAGYTYNHTVNERMRWGRAAKGSLNFHSYDEALAGIREAIKQEAQQAKVTIHTVHP